jgi:two-component system NarL family response regulator
MQVTVRIVVAEDQRLIRELLVGVLARESGVDVVGEAATGKEALALAQSTRPDILILDVELPDGDGIEVARALRNAGPRPAIIALSMHEEPYIVQQMLQAGSDAYVVKSAAVAELVQAVRSVEQGRMFLSPAIARHAVAKHALAVRLSSRENQVLALIASGYHSPAIAAKLAISVGTVEAHRRNIMAKLGLHTIAELTKYAVREGLTPS